MQLTYETKRFNFLIKIQQKCLKIYSQPLIVNYHIQLYIYTVYTRIWTYTRLSYVLCIRTVKNSVKLPKGVINSRIILCKVNILRFCVKIPILVKVNNCVQCKWVLGQSS